MNMQVRLIPTIFFSFMMLLGISGVSDAQGVGVSHLEVEYMHNPLGIDMAHPRFSWIIHSHQRGVKQAAYRILVASSSKKLAEGQADIWKTGKKKSNQSINIEYNGKKLKSDNTYYWKVQVRDQDKQWSGWSKTASFHTGLMKKSDWQGEWIGAPDASISAPLLRKGFNLKKTVTSARVFVSGIGYYELYLNGEKVGNHKLDPGTTDYNKRALYATYDVTKYLDSGDNAIGIWLGNGYFRMGKKRPFRNYVGDRPQLMLQMNITYSDGSTSHVVSNTSWKASAGPIIANSIYNGEIFDARKEKKGWDTPGYNDKKWSHAVRVKVPETRKLSAQLMPPVRVTKTIYPVSIREPKKGVYVFDFGQNLTGWPELFVKGGEGHKVIMKTAEVTQKNMLQMMGKNTTGVVNTINASSDRTAKARDIYILSGQPRVEKYQPRFTYQGFRYVQVEGYPGKPDLSSIAVQVAHTDVKQVGAFSSSNALLNRIHQNVIWGQESNLMSMPTDCPQRDERMGWMADAHLSAEEAMHNFDMAAFYTNWLNLIQDEQHKDGSVPDIVPDHKWLSGTKVGTPAWQVAYPLITWYMHEYYGDNRVIKEHYNSLKKWMGYMASIAKHDILTQGRGDWVPPERAGKPTDGSISLTSTGYYYKSASLMSKMAGVLGKDQDKAKYSKLAADIKNAFQRRFWNNQTQNYGNGSQMSNSFPLYLGVVPKKEQKTVVHDLVSNIRQKHNDHLWVGILGTKALVEALPEYGKSNVLYSMADQTTYPSWGYMISKGATTLWERWGGYKYFGPAMNSLNHIMFGSIDEFFYKDLAGIQFAAPGFKKIRIEPQVQNGLDHAKASIRTIRGKVSSGWERKGNEIQMKVIIPANSSARVSVPKVGLSGPFTVKESGQVIWTNHKFKPASGIKSAGESKNFVTFKVGSGRYDFNLAGK